MIELRVKVKQKYPLWRESMQPFLENLTKNGYRWKEKKKGIIEVHTSKEHHGTGQYAADVCFKKPAILDSVYLGPEKYTYYDKYRNIEVDERKRIMYKVHTFLYHSNPTDHEKTLLAGVYSILNSTPEFKPNFEYEFEI